MSIVKCSFCGSTLSDVVKMIKSPLNKEVFICDECANQVNSMVRESLQREVDKFKKRSDTSVETMTPSMIKKKLDEFIIGQETAKKVLSVAVYNHYKRINDNSDTIKKSNILLAGPSGSGKTHIVKTLAEILGLPLAIVSATSLTETGYVGEDVESCLTRLVDVCFGDIEMAEKGIVFIDEIDKIAKKEASATTRDVSGEGVQASLLKLIEGTEAMIPRSARDGSDRYEFHTENVLFIVGGAFEGMFSDDHSTHRSIGFGAGNVVDMYEKTSGKLTPEMLIKYGMMREFVGRFSSLVKLDELTEDDLVRILTEPKDAITKEYELLMKKDNVKLVFEEEYLHEIARLAIEKNVGARGLRSLIEETMLDIMYELPDMENVTTCTITKDSITTKKGKLRLKRKREAV